MVEATEGNRPSTEKDTENDSHTEKSLVVQLGDQSMPEAAGGRTF